MNLRRQARYRQQALLLLGYFYANPGGPLYPSDIQRDAGLKWGYLYPLLRDMESHGLIRRIQSAHTGRAHYGLLGGCDETRKATAFWVNGLDRSSAGGDVV